jgi:hypothetical protein
MPGSPEDTRDHRAGTIDGRVTSLLLPQPDSPAIDIVPRIKASRFIKRVLRSPVFPLRRRHTAKPCGSRQFMRVPAVTLGNYLGLSRGLPLDSVVAKWGPGLP